MTLKTILISMNDIDRADQLVNLAAGMGEKFGAHITGLYVIPAVQVYPAGGMQLTTQVCDGHRKYFLDHAEALKRKFQGAMNKAGIKSEWRLIESASSLIADGVIEHGRQSDLVVIPQTRSDTTSGIEVGFTEQVVMDCGRPVLVVPSFGDFADVGKNVLVAWNGTRESARAAFDAMALMKQADTVNIAWVNPQEEDLDMDLPGAEMATTMSRHGFKVTAEAIPVGDLSVGDALLSHASDVGADLLVMGAYGHSRMREFIFGGATRTILESMTIPVLMSH